MPPAFPITKPVYIVGAQGSARRAAALTQRLLAFSRRQIIRHAFSELDKTRAAAEHSAAELERAAGARERTRCSAQRWAYND